MDILTTTDKLFRATKSNIVVKDVPSVKLVEKSGVKNIVNKNSDATTLNFLLKEKKKPLKRQVIYAKTMMYI